MQIRAFDTADTDAVVALWHACGLVRPWNDPHKDIARKTRVQPELFLVGELNGAIVATAMGGYDGHRGFVYYMAVSPAHQGKRYGATLLGKLESMLLAMGCPKINLMGSCRQSCCGVLQQPRLCARNLRLLRQATDPRHLTPTPP